MKKGIRDHVKKLKIKNVGVIGQGFVGGNLSRWLEEVKGVEVVKHSLSDDRSNEIGKCDLVFVAVPTPTVGGGFFDDSILMDVLKLVREDSIVVIKSTIPYYTIKKIDREFSFELVVCPEFLDESTAWEDTCNPRRLVVGVRNPNIGRLKEMVKEIKKWMPEAPYEVICTWNEASMIKYGGNSFFYVKNVFFNLLRDLVSEVNGDYDVVREAISADPRIGDVHTYIGHKGGRGAGGHCLIKDFAIFRGLVSMMDGGYGHDAMKMIERKNLENLLKSGKDRELVESIYGELVENFYGDILKKNKEKDYGKEKN